MSIETRPAFPSRNLQAPRLNQQPLWQAKQIRFGNDAVCLTRDLSPDKESKGFFGSIGSFIKSTLSFIFIKPWRWLGEQLGLIKKPEKKVEETENSVSESSTGEPETVSEAKAQQITEPAEPKESESSEVDKLAQQFHNKIQQGDLNAVRDMLKINPNLIDSHIDDENARITFEQVGTPYAGWISFQPIYERIVREQPDLLD